MQEAERFIQYLRYEKNYSSHTVFAYQNDLKQFSDFAAQKFDIQSPDGVDGDMVRAWMLSLMEQGDTPRTVNRKLSSLKSFWRFMLREGIVTVNPLNKVLSPKIREPLPTFLRESEVASLHASAAGNAASEISCGDGKSTEAYFTEKRDNLIVEMLLQTGMRRAELIGLSVEDVDMASSQLKVTGKRNKQRIIPFGPSLRQQIEEYLDCRKMICPSSRTPLYIRYDGHPLYPMLVYRLVHSRLEQTGHTSRNSPHVLRHTFATSMLNNGAELSAVKQLLGHASLSATEVYTHTTFEELKKSYNQAHPRAGE